MQLDKVISQFLGREQKTKQFEVSVIALRTLFDLHDSRYHSFQIFQFAAYIEDYHVNLGELLRSGNLLKAQSIGNLEGQCFTPDAKNTSRRPFEIFIYALSCLQCPGIRDWKILEGKDFTNVKIYCRSCIPSQSVRVRYQVIILAGTMKRQPTRCLLSRRFHLLRTSGNKHIYQNIFKPTQWSSGIVTRSLHNAELRDPGSEPGSRQMFGKNHSN